jgi:hypothetical protein
MHDCTSLIKQSVYLVSVGLKRTLWKGYGRASFGSTVCAIRSIGTVRKPGGLSATEIGFAASSAGGAASVGTASGATPSVATNRPRTPAATSSRTGKRQRMCPKS